MKLSYIINKCKSKISVLFSRNFNISHRPMGKKLNPADIVGATPEETIHKVLIAMGFTYINEWRFDYHKESSVANNYVKVYSDHVYLKTYAKHHAYADSGSIGPPLPNARDLVSFVRYEGYFDADDNIYGEGDI